MNEISFSCSNCGKSLQAPEKMAGLPIRCQYCQEWTNVPEVPKTRLPESTKKWSIIIGVCLFAFLAIITCCYMTRDHRRFKKAVVYYRNGNYEQSLRILDTASDNFKISPQAIYLKGDCLLNIAQRHFDNKRYNECMTCVDSIPALALFRTDGADKYPEASELKKKALHQIQVRKKEQEKRLAEERAERERIEWEAAEKKRIEKERTGKKEKEEKQKSEEFVAAAIEAGIVTRIEVEFNEVYVEPILWYPLDVTEKEGAAYLFALYCGYKNGTKIFWVAIKDTYSGKKLARYSPIWGFKTY